MTHVAELTIASIAAGGDGVARDEGLAVFVPRSAPGDVARVRVRPKGRFGRGEIISLITPSERRVEPRCRHYVGDRCGGCQLQHMDYTAQLEAKRVLVGDAMRRIAKREVEVSPVVPSPAPWEYRSKLTLTMRSRSGQWTMGLRAYDDPDTIFDLHECPITQPAIVAAWREVRAASRFLPTPGELRGAIRDTGDGLSLLVEGGDRWDADQEFAAACLSLAIVVWQPEEGTRVVIADRGTRQAPIASFAQVNPFVAELLQAALLKKLVAHDPRTVIDAYAGSGDTSVAIANRGISVTAIELDNAAAAWAATRLPPSSRAISARVEDALLSALPADVVVLNPPRVGVAIEVTDILTLASTAPRAILYVSCDPATLARDVSRLARYRVASLTPFDMFPQTAHVETLCELVPESA